MTLRRHNTPPSEAQWKIIEYAKAHPGCPHKEIAVATGMSQSYVGETIMVHLPHMVKKRTVCGGPSYIQQKIIDMKKANPDLPQHKIAEKLGVARSTVSLAITTFMTDRPVPAKNHGSHAKKVTGPFTLKPCLGVCGGMHESTWDGDRICPRCKGMHNPEYIDAYSVSTGRKSSGGYRV